MLKVVAYLVIIALAMVCIEAGRGGGGGGGGKRGGKAKSEGQQPPAKQCSEWTFAECTMQAEATCGKGTKKGTRTGDNCPVKEKSFPCRIPCAKNKCKYQKGEWSECDVTSNTMTRTLTLKKGDATLCQASKVITKKCKNKSADNRKNNRRRKGGSE